MHAMLKRELRKRRARRDVFDSRRLGDDAGAEQKTEHRRCRFVQSLLAPHGRRVHRIGPDDRFGHQPPQQANDAEQHRERGDEHNPAGEGVEEAFGRRRAVVVRGDAGARDAQRVGDDGDRNRAQRDGDRARRAADR